MRYNKKKLILNWVKVGLITSGFLMLVTPHDLIARIAGVVTIFLFFTHIYIRHLMRKHFQKETKARADDPEYLFEWIVISWVGTLFGISIPGFLYVKDMISLETFDRVLKGEFAFFALYSVIALTRSYLYKRKQSTEGKERMKLESRPAKGPPTT